MKKQRLDEYLIKSGLASDKKAAFVIVTEGTVFINGQKAISPAQLITEKDKIEFRVGHKYVGRGALKLEAALKKFEINPSGKICADIGAATGGFTEILLLGGAKKVYAIDTAQGKLALKLREDPRVIVMEEADVRKLEKLPEQIDLSTIDLSLLPLENILPSVRKLLSPVGETVALFKPQYQTRDQTILRHGIIQTDEDRENLMQNFKKWAEQNSWKIKNTMESPIRGDKGNIEYLIHLTLNA